MLIDLASISSHISLIEGKNSQLIFLCLDFKRNQSRLADRQADLPRPRSDITIDIEAGLDHTLLHRNSINQRKHLL